MPVGSVHVLWLVLHVLTNSVLWMRPWANLCDLVLMVVGGHAIGNAWHDLAAGGGGAGICHASFVGLGQN